jgi:hypothetical protein
VIEYHEVPDQEVVSVAASALETTGLSNPRMRALKDPAAAIQTLVRFWPDTG